MASLKIWLLGGLEISAQGKTRLTRKAEAVVACLALRDGQPQSRERIAALFWEDSPEGQARTNLRQCLSSIRKCLGDALVVESDRIGLDPSATDIDLRQFAGLIQADSREALEAAGKIYRGDLLEGFALKEDAFEAVVRSEREHHRRLMVDGLLRLVNLCEAERDYGAAVQYSSRLLALDPLNESVHRALMRAYAAQGRYSAALKQFDLCRDVLERELGVQPQPETLELQKELRNERRRQPDQELIETPALDDAPEFKKLGVEFELPQKPSVILMPFRDLSENGELAHFAEGVRIDIQSSLVKISGLFLIAAGSAATYSDRDVPPEQVSQEMAVKHVVTGTVQGNTERVRLTAQLTDGINGTIVWSERYDRELDDTFHVQDEIAEKIVTSLDVKLVAGEQAKVWRKTLRNPKALELYYRGLAYLITFDQQSVAAARQLFEKVTEISPDVTLGPTYVAFSHYWDATMDWSPDTDAALHLAQDWAERAAAMEDADGQAHAILAHVKLLFGQHDEALQIVEEAIRIRPLCAMTNALSGNILLYCGKPIDAVERVKSAIRAAPVYASWWVEILAAAYRDSGQYRMAIAAATELLRKSPDNLNGRLILTGALVADNRLPEARENAQRIMSQNPEFSLSRYVKQHHYRDDKQLEVQLANLRVAGLPG